MATWKKVVVSGSSPNFATVQVDNLTSGQVVIGGGTGNLSTTAVNGTGNILATTGASGVTISGSFSGSFSGTAATASVAISASYAVTSSLPLQGIITASVNVSTITFTKGDQSTFNLVISQPGSAASANAVSINNSSTGIWYPTFVVSGSSSQSLYVNSASFQYNAITNTLGVTSSYAATASYFITSSVTSASYAATASYVTNALTASYFVTSSVTSASYASTASYVNNALTASYVVTALTASYFITSSVTSASYAATASYVVTALTASYFTTGSVTSASYAATASYVNSALTASYFVTSSVTSASYAATASSVNTLNQNVTITGSLFVSSSIVLTPSGSISVVSGSIIALSFTGSHFGTSSWAQNFLTSSVTSASYAATASYVVTALTASYFVTSSVTSASYASTASYVVTALTASYFITSSVTSASYSATASYVVTALTASFLTSSNVYGPYGSNSVLTSSYAVTAAYAANGGAVANSLTFGSGLSGSAATFNGSTAVTVAVSGAVSLSSNNVPKWAGAGFVNSNITDTGTQIQVAAGASSGVSVAAGGVNVTGNSTFNNDVTVAGNFAVNGTTTFINTTNLYVKDQFVMINSGSSGLADAGLVAAYSASGVGSALYLETNTAGVYGRWAVAYDVSGSATTVTVDEYMVTAKIGQASAPSAAPTWGSGTNGTGNIWITNAGDIYIYS